GVAIGYREKELEAAGLTRKDRVPKLEESLDVMKRLWRGDEVTFDGAYTKLAGVRMGFPPCQRPHPPLEMGAQSVGATRRAARLVDTVFFGPQVSWADVGRLVKVYREARTTEGPGTPGRAIASRSLIVGASKETAHAAAKAYLERTFAMYRGWEMQEPTMVPLQLGFDISLDDWTINGTPAQLDDDAVAYAGGTELLLLMKEGLLRPRHLVDVKRIPGFDGVAAADGHATIGATVTHRALERAATVRERCPVVASVARHVAN